MHHPVLQLTTNIRCMGSVDNADQKRNKYCIPIKSPRWFPFSGMVNAFILHQLSPNHKASRSLISTQNCSIDLMETIHHARQNKTQHQLTEVRDSKSHFAICETLNRCAYCPSRGQRHRSSWGCALCAVILCGGCFEHYTT